mgnify:CR=1 FL=1
MKNRLEHISTETELGHTIVPSYMQTVIAVRLFTGDPPQVGQPLVIKRGKVSMSKGGQQLEMSEDKSELDGTWMIEAVEMRSNYLEITIGKYADE